MGTRYTTNAASGYASLPPPDDGTVSESNKIKFSTIKTKLADPIKTLADTINSELVTHFNNGPSAVTANTTLGASHYNQVIQASGTAVTLTLSDAATLLAGWYCWVRNTDTAESITIGRATAGDTFNGTAANYSLKPNEAIMIVCNAAANGFITVSLALGDNQTIPGAWTFAGTLAMSSKPINEAKGADIASAATTDIGAATGNFVDVTGTTTITALGTVQAGARRVVRFTGSLTLTHNATSLILPGAANITTYANDRAEFISLGSGNWLCTRYTRAGLPPTPTISSQEFTSSGNFTVPDGVTSVLVTLVGGGGGGGGGANDTVGPAVVASAGGATSFGTLSAAGGGAGGNGVSNLAVGAGGSGGAGGGGGASPTRSNFGIQSAGNSGSAGTVPAGGVGASVPLVYSAGGANGAPGAVGTFGSGGGAGNGNIDGGGGGGGSGAVIHRRNFTVTPGGSVTVTIGAAGAGGVGAAGAGDGGAGGSGLCVVEWVV